MSIPFHVLVVQLYRIDKAFPRAEITITERGDR